MTKQQEKKKRFYQKRSFRITIGSIVGFIVLVLFIFRVSPAPGAWVIRSVFDRNSAKILAALEKHQPSVAITSELNRQYRTTPTQSLMYIIQALRQKAQSYQQLSGHTVALGFQATKLMMPPTSNYSQPKVLRWYL